MIKQGLVLTCTKCSTKNFLDPYPFWNFSGNTKCADEVSESSKGISLKRSGRTE